MALLARPRRGLALVLLAMLIAPAVAIPLRPFTTVSVVENRTLAAVPARPHSRAEWRALPRRVDSFLSDHFAFREHMIAMNNRMFGKAQRSDSGQADLAAAINAKSEPANAGAGSDLAAAVDGKAGRMFLTEGLLRSTGHEVDAKRAADFARWVCDVARGLKPTHTKLLFAIAPSPASIYPEYAPDWALPPRSPTEYDLILNDVRTGCGVQGVDLRPGLRRWKKQTYLYRLTDTHWREIGALIGYNQTVKGLGHPEWALDAGRAGWVPVTLTDGDLPRLGGLPPRAEADLATPYVELPPGAERHTIMGLTPSEKAVPFEVHSGHVGPSLLIVGDSYTEHFFPGFLMHAGFGRAGWIHEEECRFDWRVIERFKPDYLLLMPVDRLAFCPTRGALPRFYPGTANPPPSA